MLKHCCLCNQGTVVLKQQDFDYTYLGVTKSLPSFYWLCDCCGSDYSDAQLSKANKYIIEHFKTTVDQKEI